MLDVGGHGLGADEERGRNVLLGSATGEQGEDLVLACGSAANSDAGVSGCDGGVSARRSDRRSRAWNSPVSKGLMM